MEDLHNRYEVYSESQRKWVEAVVTHEVSNDVVVVRYGPGMGLKKELNLKDKDKIRPTISNKFVNACERKECMYEHGDSVYGAKCQVFSQNLSEWQEGTIVKFIKGPRGIDVRVQYGFGLEKDVHIEDESKIQFTDGLKERLIEVVAKCVERKEYGRKSCRRLRSTAEVAGEPEVVEEKESWCAFCKIC